MDNERKIKLICQWSVVVESDETPPEIRRIDLIPGIAYITQVVDSGLFGNEGFAEHLAKALLIEITPHTTLITSQIPDAIKKALAKERIFAH